MVFFRVYFRTDAHSCKELHTRSHKYALQNFQQVVGTEEFLLLPFSEVSKPIDAFSSVLNSKYLHNVSTISTWNVKLNQTQICIRLEKLCVVRHFVVFELRLSAISCISYLLYEVSKIQSTKMRSIYADLAYLPALVQFAKRNSPDLNWETDFEIGALMNVWQRFWSPNRVFLPIKSRIITVSFFWAWQNRSIWWK